MSFFKPLPLTAAALLGLLFFTGCKDSSTAVETEGVPSTVSFTYAVSMVENQSLQRAARAGSSSLTGEMLAINLSTSDTTRLDWYVVVNNDLFTGSSNKSAVLKPGTYDFRLSVSGDKELYAGKTSGVVIGDRAEVTVPMTLSPVIGNVELGSDLTQLASLIFKYPAEEFSALAAPRIGVRIDGGSETVYEVNKAAGLTSVYFELPAGNHTFSVNLYDGGLLAGRSMKAVETADVKLTKDVIIDIAPLHGEMKFDLAMQGADAGFSFTIPSAVVEEVGGLANLKAALSIVGPVNGLRTQSVSFAASGSNYVGTAVLSNYRYDTVNVQILFTDSRNNEQVASALASSIVLTKSNQNALMNVLLRRRALITGNILGTVGLNVLDNNNDPVQGVSIFSNGVLAGITGSGSFGTAGYLKLFLKKGTYTLEASNDTLIGRVSASVNPLDVKNLDIKVSRYKTAEVPLVADSYTGYYNTGSNYGTAPSIQVSGTASGMSTDQLFLKFDLSVIPEGVTLYSSKLSMVCYTGFAYGADGTCYTYLADSDNWTETGITHANKPGRTGVSLGGWWLWYNSNTAESPVSIATPELNDAVRSQYVGDKVISLNLYSPGYRTVYYSKESAQPAKASKLKVTYLY